MSLTTILLIALGLALSCIAYLLWKGHDMVSRRSHRRALLLYDIFSEDFAKAYQDATGQPKTYVEQRPGLPPLAKAYGAVLEGHAKFEVITQPWTKKREKGLDFDAWFWSTSGRWSPVRDVWTGMAWGSKGVRRQLVVAALRRLLREQGILPPLPFVGNIFR